MKRFISLAVLVAFVMMAGFASADVGLNKRNVWTAKQFFKYGADVEGSLTINGQPVDSTVFSNIWYVSSATGSNTRGNDYGKSWEKPFATVDYAINQCTANTGNIIYVLPNHAESFAAADGFDADVAGIFIAGLGSGADLPEFTFTNTAATVAVGAANVTFANLRFIAGISDIVKGIAVETAGDNFTMIGCEWPVPGTATFEFLDVIELATGADGFTIEDCKYRDGTSSATNHFIEAGAGVNANMRIVNNDIQGRFAVSAIWSDKADTAALISGNTIRNDIAGQHCVEFTSTANGMITDNRLYANAYATTLDPGSMYCAGNLAASAIDEAGTPIPALGDSTDNYLGTNSANNDADSSSVAANQDGSALERLEQIQEAINNGTGTAIGTNKSIVDLLGTTGVALVDDALSVVGILGVNDADNAFASNTVVANHDGSILERLEAIATSNFPNYKHPNYLAVSTGTFDTTGVWSTAASHEVATVTGAVLMTILPEIKVTVASVGDNGTLSLGDETTAASLIAATTMGSGLGAAGEWWVDNSLDDTVVIGSKIEALTFVVGNGKDIGYTVGTNAMSGGSITFHIWWTPLDSTGAVAAGAGGTL